jgi:hypothetical protein
LAGADLLSLRSLRLTGADLLSLRSLRLSMTECGEAIVRVGSDTAIPILARP